MENLYGGFHYTTEAPPPLAPSSNNISVAVSSIGSSSPSDHAVMSTNNVILLQQHEEQDHEEEISKKVLRAKVASHPLFPQLLHNYIDCRKVGAPLEIAQLLDEIIISREENNIGLSQIPHFYGADPELHNFMETYCNLLGKYKYELSRPFEEATAFLNDMETQLNSIISEGPPLCGSSSEKEEETINESTRINDEDQVLKDNLLRRYSGYISSLKNEFSKNKKKERLPNEAKEILLAWWNIHFKWPYPTDADKVALAERTGLDQKQVNNWFINQRKRHWKPYEEMQAALVDTIYGPISMTSDDISWID